MDFRKIFLIAIWIFLIAVAVSPSYAADGNAVGGSAYSDAPGGPLGDVHVSVAQDPSIRDQTRNEDGVYTLKVPLSRTHFDLLYQKAGYLDGNDLDITNDKDQQKRPIARMTPTNNIGTLSPDKLQRLVDGSIAAMRRGRALAISPLQQSGRRNLETLQGNIKPSNAAFAELKAKISQALVE